MDDSLTKIDNYDEITRNISKNLEELNEILKNSKIECKILENGLNVAGNMCYKFDNLVINENKTEMYDLGVVDALFTKFNELEAEDDKKKFGSTLLLNQTQQSESEIDKILRDINSTLNNINNSKFLDVNGNKIKKKTEDARSRFHNLAFDLEKINKDLKVIIDSRKANSEDSVVQNPLDGKFNEELTKIKKVLQDLQFVKSNQNLVANAGKIIDFKPMLSCQIDSLIDVMDQNLRN